MYPTKTAIDLIQRQQQQQQQEDNCQDRQRLQPAMLQHVVPHKKNMTHVTRQRLRQRTIEYPGLFLIRTRRTANTALLLPYTATVHPFTTAREKVQKSVRPPTRSNNPRLPHFALPATACRLPQSSLRRLGRHDRLQKQKGVVVRAHVANVLILDRPPSEFLGMSERPRRKFLQEELAVGASKVRTSNQGRREGRKDD